MDVGRSPREPQKRQRASPDVLIMTLADGLDEGSLKGQFEAANARAISLQEQLDAEGRKHSRLKEQLTDLETVHSTTLDMKQLEAEDLAKRNLQALEECKSQAEAAYQELCRERSHLEAALQREIAKRRAVEVDKTKAEARVKDTESKLAEVERRLKVEQSRRDPVFPASSVHEETELHRVGRQSGPVQVICTIKATVPYEEYWKHAEYSHPSQVEVVGGVPADFWARAGSRTH